MDEKGNNRKTLSEVMKADTLIAEELSRACSASSITTVTLQLENHRVTAQTDLPPLNREYNIRHEENDSFEVDVRKLFYDTLKGGPMFYTPLQQKAMGLLNCFDTGFWNNIFLKAKNMGVVQNITAHSKSKWALPRPKGAAVADTQQVMFPSPGAADEPVPY